MKMNKDIEQQLIFKLLGLGENENDSTIPNKKSFIGKKVLIRTYSAGVHFGTMVSKRKQNVFLENAHRIYHWKGACTLSQLAMEGVKDLENSKISMAVNEIEIDQVIEVILMGEGVFEQLTSKIWKKQ